MNNAIKMFFRWKYVASTQHAICDHAGAVHRDKVSFGHSNPILIINRIIHVNFDLLTPEEARSYTFWANSLIQ